MLVLRLRGRAPGARVPPLRMTQPFSRQSFDCAGAHQVRACLRSGWHRFPHAPFLMLVLRLRGRAL